MRECQKAEMYFELINELSIIYVIHHYFSLAASRIDSWQPARNSVLHRRIDFLENVIKQIAVHMAMDLFQRQRDNSRDIDQNSASGACGNEDEEQQV